MRTFQRCVPGDTVFQYLGNCIRSHDGIAGMLATTKMSVRNVAAASLFDPPTAEAHLQLRGIGPSDAGSITDLLHLGAPVPRLCLGGVAGPVHGDSEGQGIGLRALHRGSGWGHRVAGPAQGFWGGGKGLRVCTGVLGLGHRVARNICSGRPKLSADRQAGVHACRRAVQACVLRGVGICMPRPRKSQWSTTWSHQSAPLGLVLLPPGLLLLPLCLSLPCLQSHRCLCSFVTRKWLSVLTGQQQHARPEVTS